MMKRAALFGAAALLLLAVHAPHVDAATASPILTSDNDEIEFAKDEEGSQTATLTITNPSTDVVTLEIIGREEIKDCGFKVEPSSVPARRTVSVSITTNSCPFPDDGAIASLIAGGTEAASLTLKSAHPKEPLELDRIFEDLLVAALGAAIAMVVVYLMRPSVSGTKVQATDEVAGVDAGWSFADSWATNISAFANRFRRVARQHGGLDGRSGRGARRFRWPCAGGGRDLGFPHRSRTPRPQGNRQDSQTDGRRSPHRGIPDCDGCGVTAHHDRVGDRRDLT